MKTLWITLTISILAWNVNAQSRDTATTRVKWTWKLPPPVRRAWKNCAWSTWHVFGIKRLVTRTDTLYSIHVALFQALGPDDADIAEEDLLFFSPAGRLLKTQKL